MKILDLLIEDLVNTNWKEKEYNGVLKSRPMGVSDQRKSLGSGNNASVKPDPNDPHMVRKHNTHTYRSPEGFDSGTNDGFNKYIEYLITYNLTDNIHFPKVYDINTIKDKHGQKIHTYRIEKLIESSDVSPEEVEAFVHRDLGPDFKNYGTGTIAVIESACDYLAECILDATWNKERISGLSDTMKDAVKILGQISRVIGQRTDLHSGNIMWRRTPHGMIFVFNDPFY